MKESKVFLNLTSVFCFIYGAIYCFSLVFIPIGIYCFVAGKKFSYKADHILDNFAVDQKTLRGYAIFVSIACFPFGLLIWVAYNKLFGHNIKVEGFNYERINEVPKEENESNINKDENVEKNETVEENVAHETDSEKLEKLEKLKNFKEKGIITEEEFEMAKEQMFGKDNK